MLWRWMAGFGVWCLGLRVLAQIDSEHRELVQVGYNQPIEGRAPFAGYAYYYHNQPGFIRTNWVLRAAIAPVYLDAELGMKGALGPQTDLGIGIAGGGFADNYAEVRSGKWIRAESFDGHAAELNLSVYHLFNPVAAGHAPSSIAEMPLQGVLRAGFRDSFFSRLDDTAPDFKVPDDLPAGSVRAGLRWGGREPLLSPTVAVELSVWYQGHFRVNPQTYGYADDRRIEAVAHQFWARALLAYTLTNSAQHFEVSLTAGTSLNPDRFNAFRLGGTLPMAAEFPLVLPGYYFEELSARQFVLLDGLWSVPVVGGWDLVVYGGTAYVNYVPGLSQPGNWHTGLGGGLGWTSPTGAWQILAGYAYGIDAIRGDERGGHNVGLMVQWDLERRGGAAMTDADRVGSWVRRLNPSSWRGFNSLFQH